MESFSPFIALPRPETAALGSTGKSAEPLLSASQLQSGLAGTASAKGFPGESPAGRLARVSLAGSARAEPGEAEKCHEGQWESTRLRDEGGVLDIKWVLIDTAKDRASDTLAVRGHEAERFKACVAARHARKLPL